MRERLLAVVAIVALVACDRGSTAPVGNGRFQDLPADHVMLDVRQYLTDDGIRRGVLNADTAYVFVDSGKVKLRKVTLQIFGTTGMEVANLVSRTGELNQRNNVMVARGNVVLVTREGGRRIETEELHYDPNQHRIWSTVATTMQENGSRITGDGFTADDQMQNIQVTRPRGTVSGMKVKF
ncbi:MAG: LPS export ABC transporter periplasmic protein LptC [Gemmatimonadetes bacterium]|nr:LPS export ABC transporter periplasmic protein LptC [Gemmatimonadota bacterium]